jgi:hypothetical protein
MDELRATPGIFRKVQNRGRDEEVRAFHFAAPATLFINPSKLTSI